MKMASSGTLVAVLSWRQNLSRMAVAHWRAFALCATGAWLLHGGLLAAAVAGGAWAMGAFAGGLIRYVHDGFPSGNSITGCHRWTYCLRLKASSKVICDELHMQIRECTSVFTEWWAASP
jgi:hypothetical protein